MDMKKVNKLHCNFDTTTCQFVNIDEGREQQIQKEKFENAIANSLDKDIYR